MLTLMGTFLQINPVWKFGPYNPGEVTAGSQPDWYMGWLEGAVRITLTGSGTSVTPPGAGTSSFLACASWACCSPC
ncbi:ubiquinol-cytochrome c reductase [Cutibacterium acnes JCM 18918]|nr:ubiquinol-cytochrome c reductase [Cutibacterium acnes JCM 18918]